jgi:hypothetical protein
MSVCNVRPCITEPERVKLSRVESYFEGVDLAYPASRAAAARACPGTSLLMADGEVDLGALVVGIRADTVVDAHDLYVELRNTLPIGAVGDPMQSEGDA